MSMTTNGKSKERTDWLRSHGLCVSCKQPVAVHSTWYCPDCLYKHAEKQRNITANLTDEEREERRIKRKKRYEQRKAQGICIYCNRPAVPEINTCSECRLKRNRTEQERRRRLKYED